MPESALSTYDRRALAVSLAAALGIHGALLVGLPRLIAPRSKAQPPQTPAVSLGRDQSTQPVRLAWISHEAYEQLQARRSPTKQPALQRWIEPTFEPLLRFDPASVNKSNVQGPKSKVEDAHSEVDSAIEGPKTPMAEQKQQAKARAEVAASAGARVKDQPSPTAAARADRESTPATPGPTDVTRPGKVKVGPGLEIKTVSPRFSAVTRASTLPRNPVARLTFNGQGQVINAQLLRSSGAANVDGPVLSALYRWQATGEKLSQMHTPFTHTFRIVLVDE